MLAEFHLYNGNKLKISSNGEIFLIEKHKCKEMKRQVQCNISDFFPYVQKVQINTRLKRFDYGIFNLIQEKFEDFEIISNGPIGSMEENSVDLGKGCLFLGEVSTQHIFGTGKNILEYFDPIGINQNVNTDYLKFQDKNGSILFIAKTPVKHSVSWDSINGGSDVQEPNNAESGVYGAMQKVIDGETYKIRLLKGASSNPSSGTGIARHKNSEWDDLLVALVSASVGYTDSTLITNYDCGNGSLSWVQEQNPAYHSLHSDRVNRGYYGVSVFNSSHSSGTLSDYGWRPVLELIHQEIH
jgi:hypothetical protein